MMRLAVLGDPVEHSLSPRLHQAALAALGIDGTYEALRVTRLDMGRLANEVRSGGLDGANITMPHKRVAAELADSLHDEAAAIGSVNTWVRRAGELIGYSTDGQGILFAISFCHLPPDGPVLVLGAGGAAAAAVQALRDRPLHISARRTEAARSLKDRLSEGAVIIPWGTGVEGALIVNATPLGMNGEPLPQPVLESAGGLLDMVYGGIMTPAVASARKSGLPVSDGLPMLVGQARESFRLWTGFEVPAGVMVEAANLSSDSVRPPK